jgi:hypothetical protein
MLYIRRMDEPLATHVIILNEIAHPEHRPNGWRLRLQWARHQYDDKSEPETGYRFIWRRPDGSLQPARGQARIPSLADAELLIRLAVNWDGATSTPTMHLVMSNKMPAQLFFFNPSYGIDQGTEA